MVKSVSGHIIDVVNERIYLGTVRFENEYITEILEESREEREGEPYILPGFVDAHVHVESSMLAPSEFARIAVVHGTVATVSDPHEIANVLGIEGVRYMIECGEKTPFKFAFGAPSCVPATGFETSGAVLDPAEVEELLLDERIRYLSEMMNYPGVIHDDPEVLAKIRIAHQLGKLIDGHAPGLRGEGLKKYVSAGITTDHESFEYEEGKEKLELGMKLLIREGSAAKNFEALHRLISEYPDSCMFCSDDKHPDDLVESHIDGLVRRALAQGHDLMTVLRTASVHPVEHYGLNVGLLRPGDPADCIEVRDLESMQVIRTRIDGQIVAEHGKTLIESRPIEIVNNFTPRIVDIDELRVPFEGEGSRLNVIGAINGQIVTEEREGKVLVENGEVLADIEADLLKIAVVNRYQHARPAIAFINGFGFQRGAIASSVAHDSHNIVAVGASDEELCRAINLVMKARGGLSMVAREYEDALPLPVAGLMSDKDAYSVASSYSRLDSNVKEKLGTTLTAPYMTLSFMALLVIPSLKLSDKGLFDGGTFRFISLFGEDAS
ncbi:MAG: adenine deaminase [Chlorobi bacterium]|nr:adenine deaminase [Chlorobiota bacterium]